MDFDGDRFPFFKVFAGVCVTRHIITAVKAASRKKHLPLNSYVSLDKNTYDDDSDTTLLDIIAFSELQDPEYFIDFILHTIHILSINQYGLRVLKLTERYDVKQGCIAVIVISILIK